MNNNKLTIALAGNPNSGKTTIFNIITGTRQKVGNWPGVTVEKKEGTVEKFGYELTVIDLPGTYSLTPFSIEEIIARNYVIEESPDVVRGDCGGGPVAGRREDHRPHAEEEHRGLSAYDPEPLRIEPRSARGP